MLKSKRNTTVNNTVAKAFRINKAAIQVNSANRLGEVDFNGDPHFTPQVTTSTVASNKELTQYIFPQTGFVRDPSKNGDFKHKDFRPYYFHMFADGSLVEAEEVSGDPVYVERRAESFQNVAISFIPRQVWPEPGKDVYYYTYINIHENVAFQRAILNNVFFQGSAFSAMTFREASCEKTNFNSTIFQSANFDKANLTNALFEGASFTDSVSFRKANLTGASFKNVTIKKADFSGANCRDVDFTRADILEVVCEGDEIIHAKNIYSAFNVANSKHSILQRRADYLTQQVENALIGKNAGHQGADSGEASTQKQFAIHFKKNVLNYFSEHEPFIDKLTCDQRQSLCQNVATAIDEAKAYQAARFIPIETLLQCSSVLETPLGSSHTSQGSKSNNAGEHKQGVNDQEVNDQEVSNQVTKALQAIKSFLNNAHYWKPRTKFSVASFPDTILKLQSLFKMAEQNDRTVTVEMMKSVVPQDIADHNSGFFTRIKRSSDTAKFYESIVNANSLEDIANSVNALSAENQSNLSAQKTWAATNHLHR